MLEDFVAAISMMLGFVCLAFLMAVGIPVSIYICYKRRIMEQKQDD